MSLNFYLGEVTAQSAAAKQMANEYMQFCGTLKDSVNAFMNAPLSGKTYDSAKLYFSTVYPTLASGFILACEALIEAHSKFPEEFQSQVDTCDVIEDQLKAEIAQGQALLQSMARTMDKEKEPNQRLEQRYMGVQSSIQKNEEKLQRLYEFNASSPGLFADFEAQLANLDAGLAEVEKGAAWNSGSGTFDLGRMNMAWMKPIGRAWDKRQKKIDAKVETHRLENQDITYTFDEFGNVTGVYVDGTFDPKMTLMVQEAIATNNWNALKAFGVGIADKIYENFGLSALMGERTLDTDSVGTAPYAAGQFFGDLSSIVGGGAEFLGGFSWFVGGNTLSFAGSPFTGGASLTLSPAATATGSAAMAHGGGAIWNAFDSIGNGYDINKSHKFNPGKNDSPVWKKLDNVKGMDRKSSGQGNKKRYFEWDHTHNDIEVYDKKGRHLGSMDPISGEMYKPAVPGRTIAI
ncbi:hypothetical protein JZO66_03960 [Enterococcus sp. DIV0242_7C1]|uniref:LXG domain-containing protein n=1 Tax=Candidatus Enterococcus dunnyi TaxID=1834192 RepID=A0A200JCU3_9ENTE|nr:MULTISPECIES: colicin E3/pyocin S6 family cytotoxin [unclassified Enterococcus]MBO0469689.1 hypothetical protein [Enterococcus sp. DIV0242_7C1]OUZ35014.1 hypothetical protein A5889_000489 [Enterococcus sp. 9D6_DIV0238]